MNALLIALIVLVGFAVIVGIGVLVGRTIAFRDYNPPAMPSDQEEQ